MTYRRDRAALGASYPFLGRPIQKRGMQVQHTRVDFLAPQWSCAICAWSNRTGQWNFPHTFGGVLHAALKVAA